jgi:DNA polymerase III subunit epsilon
MQFVALDVETANPDRASICEIGLVRFENGEIVDEWQTYVDPKSHFDPICMRVHGINPEKVQGAPTITELEHELRARFENQDVVHYTVFDRTALNRAFLMNDLTPFGCRWLDCTQVVRRAWPEYSRRGYGLANVTKRLSIEFEHHSAQEDARAAVNGAKDRCKARLQYHESGKYA